MNSPVYLKGRSSALTHCITFMHTSLFSPMQVQQSILNKNINARCNNLKELQFIWENLSILKKSLDPNLWISQLGIQIYIGWSQIPLKINGPHYGPQDLVTVFLGIQIGVDKMQLCSLSVASACPFHNRPSTMRHPVQNIDISKPLTHMP